MAAVNHADSFERYGTGATGQGNMARDAAYLAIGANVSPSTSNPPSGRTHHARSTPVTGGATEALRVSLGGDKTTVRVAGRFYVGSLPADNVSTYLWQLRDNANAAQLTLRLNSTGALEIMRGAISGTSLGASASPVITAGTYHYVEFLATINDTTGATEVRVDGVAVSGLTLTGQDTAATAIVSAAQYVIARPQTTGGVTIDFCDVSHGDVNAFVGDTSWYWLMPTADTAVTDWVRNTGSNDFECIDDVVPDDDTTYIEATTTGDDSEFGLANLPAHASTVVSVIAISLAKKTDPGSANLQQKAVSGASTTAGASQPLTTTYAYYKDLFATDPATGVAWTPAGFNAALLNLTKSV